MRFRDSLAEKFRAVVRMSCEQRRCIDACVSQIRLGTTVGHIFAPTSLLLNCRVFPKLDPVGVSNVLQSEDAMGNFDLAKIYCGDKQPSPPPPCLLLTSRLGRSNTRISGPSQKQKFLKNLERDAIREK